MSTTLVPTQPVTVDPLADDDALETVDAAVARLVDKAVAHVDREINCHIRTREVAWAVRHIRNVKANLDSVVADPPPMGAAVPLVDGYRPELVTAFKTLNPAASAEASEAAVDDYLEKVRGKLAPAVEAGASRRKKSGGS